MLWSTSEKTLVLTTILTCDSVY